MANVQGHLDSTPLLPSRLSSLPLLSPCFLVRTRTNHRLHNQRQRHLSLDIILLCIPPHRLPHDLLIAPAPIISILIPIAIPIPTIPIVIVIPGTSFLPALPNTQRIALPLTIQKRPALATRRRENILQLVDRRPAIGIVRAKRPESAQIHERVVARQVPRRVGVQREARITPAILHAQLHTVNVRRAPTLPCEGEAGDLRREWTASGDCGCGGAGGEGGCCAGVSGTCVVVCDSDGGVGADILG